MKKLVSLLMCVLMITSMANLSSIVNAVTSAELSTATEEIKETAGNDEEVSENEKGFETEEVSETEKATEEVADDGLVDKKILGYFNGHTVEVSGMLPKVATLSLTPVDDETAQKLVSAKRSDGTAVFACDIKIIDADGEEWQPNETVKVKVTGIEETEKELQFIHVSGDVDEVLAMDEPSYAIQTISDVTVDKNGNVTFETDGFSTFAGFTVDFHYNGKTFSIAGMTDVLLSEVFS